MKRPKRPAESKSGRVFQTSNLPTDSIGIDLCHSRLTGLLVERAARARVREWRMVTKARTPSDVQAMCTVWGRQGVWQGLSQDATGSR